MKTLKLYKSSAGSGKTFTLVSEYLKLILRTPEDYKATLAITFTNKAAAEMKTRIIETLVSMSKGEDSPMRKMLADEFPKMDLTERSGKVLKLILHDYSSFSVSTIDSFFQSILRALSREIHLPINMEVKVEIDDAILDITDRLMKDIGVDKEITEWLTDLALQKIDDDKGWNIEEDLKSVGKELFKENHHKLKMLSREEIHNYYKRLILIRRNFESQMKSFGEKTLIDFEKHSLEIADFSFGAGGVAGYFNKICNKIKPDNYKMGSRVLDALQNPEKWVTKASKRKDEIIPLVEKYFQPALLSISNFLDREFKNYLTALEILRKIYLFGIVVDLQKKLSAYRNENNIILLSDTTRLLNDIIDEHDAPFLYEKTGNRYKHLLIDEFQDTSLLQWKNLLPLIVNTLGSGFTTLVVGDAKQSIYRWRGGNMNLLLSDLFSDLQNFKSLLKEEVLSKNYRSKEVIVNFNNQFFQTAPNLLNSELDMNDFSSLKLAYGEDLKQDPKANDKAGYVRVDFLESTEDEEGERSPWDKNALEIMNNTIRDLLKMNYTYGDICILVRSNKEGNEIANSLFENKIENIVSPDSLLISASPRISFLVNTLRFLLDNKNTIARSEILYYYSIYHLKHSTEKLHETFHDHKRSGEKKSSKKVKAETLFHGLEDNLFNEILPDQFTAHIRYLGKLPVYELCEQLISIFNLNESPDAYVQRFQDMILEYSSKSDSSLEGFIRWWDETDIADKVSVIIPENTDAIRIMTIHRSKGLQFPVVLMPFTDWKILPKANQVMWMQTQGSEFDELGLLAVSANKRLLDSHFQEAYQLETNHTVIDNLNLLYVAFTRAEERLYITCPVDPGKDLNSVSKLISRSCKAMQPEFDGKLFESGNVEDSKSKEKKDDEHLQVLMPSYPSVRWQEKLSLTTHSTELLSLLEDKRMLKINYGILVHQVLAEINSIDEVDDSISKIAFKGLIGEDEKKLLEKEIKEVLSVPEIKKYFDKEFVSLSEREFILPGGEILRPDRVVFKDKEATVIDFKTGKREKKHEEQVQRYADVLRTMNYSPVKASLVYLGERIVVEI